MVCVRSKIKTVEKPTIRHRLAPLAGSSQDPLLEIFGEFLTLAIFFEIALCHVHGSLVQLFSGFGVQLFAQTLQRSWLLGKVGVINDFDCNSLVTLKVIGHFEDAVLR